MTTQTSFEGVRQMLKSAIQERDEARRERDEARAENERLRAALKPFADAGEFWATTADGFPDAMIYAPVSGPVIRSGDLIAARQALERKPE